ncbi:TonB-dependent receptor [Temperatibacter marinus]|uniref:TonB-dependent receptor n=1 Tax=Temperatibacter marinus TaxID=1456591 RepID=A0AA52H9J1_9PROT|nr:TonB-dependent receptor [Temperatibacter marinus]WND02964.1 TonB-dependent receptor [Temperatibacter marinus]
MLNSRKKMLFMSGVSVALCMQASAVSAQDDDLIMLEEIVITAQKREQGLQDVPISISALTSKMMVEKGITDLVSMSSYTPNFKITQAGTANTIQMRGIYSGQNQGFEQSVGTYVDNIHTGRGPMSKAPFYDLERVEVLKGPQSILFGKNSIAGALNITTAAPTDEVEGFVAVDYEMEFSSKAITAVLSGPLSDTMRARVAVKYNDEGGYVYNDFLDKDLGNKDEFSIRGKLEWDVSDDLVVGLKVEHSEFDSDGKPYESVGQEPARAGSFAGSGLRFNQILGVLTGIYGLPGGENIDNQLNYVMSTGEEYDANSVNSYVLNAVYSTEAGTFTATTGYVDSRSDELCDCDFTSVDIFSFDLHERYNQLSQEVRFQSPLGEDFDYVIGGFYQTSDLDFYDNINVTADSLLVALGGARAFLADTRAHREASTETDSWSVFAQGTWTLSDSVQLMVGGRYTKESKTGARTLDVQNADGSELAAGNIANLVYAGGFKVIEHEVAGELSEGKFSPDVKLLWNASDDVLLYTSWSIGYKSAGFDFRGNNQGYYDTMEESFDFEAEKAENYEIGGKVGFWDGRAELNFAIYDQSFENLQVSVYDGTLGFNVGNAATASSKGIEVDGRLALTETITARYAAAYNDFKYGDYHTGQCSFDNPEGLPEGDFPGLCDYSGLRSQFHSKFQGNIGLEYRDMISDSLEFSLSADINHTSGFNPAATQDSGMIQPSNQLIDARIGIENVDDGWSIFLLGKNLKNETIVTYSANQPLAFSSFGAPSRTANVMRPRTITLQAKIQF